jgi:hypothetical protein
MTETDPNPKLHPVMWLQPPLDCLIVVVVLGTTGTRWPVLALCGLGTLLGCYAVLYLTERAMTVVARRYPTTDRSSSQVGLIVLAPVLGASMLVALHLIGTSWLVALTLTVLIGLVLALFSYALWVINNAFVDQKKWHQARPTREEIDRFKNSV